MEFEGRERQLDALFNAFMHGRMRYYYPLLAREVPKLAIIMAFSGGIYLNRKIAALAS